MRPSEPGGRISAAAPAFAMSRRPRRFDNERLHLIGYDRRELRATAGIIATLRRDLPAFVAEEGGE
jgi:hypothetical protein